MGADSLQPINVTAATLLAQLALCGIVLGAAAMLHLSGLFHRRYASWTSLPWIAAALLLSTIGGLVFTNEFSPMWAPLFGTPALRLLPATWVILVTFLVDILCVWFLVKITGGGRESPFAPLYFLLPPLALFLREPAGRVILYVLLVGAAYTHTLLQTREPEAPSDDELPAVPIWFVSISALILATFIGLVTRPR